jgi:hypothetical protein
MKKAALILVSLGLLPLSLSALEIGVGFHRLTGLPSEDNKAWDDPDRFADIDLDAFIAFDGVIAAASGADIEVTGAFWKVDQFVYDPGTQDQHFFIEITTGAAAGARFDIVGNRGNSVTVDLDGGNLGSISPGDEMRVVAKWSLDQLFPDGKSLIVSTDSTIGSEILFPVTVPGGVDFSTSAVFRYRSDLGRWIDASAPATDVGKQVIENGALLVIRQEDQTPITPLFAGFSSAGTPIKAAVTYQGTELPEISVEQPVNVDLTDGSSIIDFGEVGEGASGQLTFTIRNPGTGELNGLATSVAGADSSEFVASVPLVTSLDPGQSTSFTVQFQPDEEGAKTATLSIASNDADENPFEIALTGMGIPATTLTSWGAGFGLSGDQLLPNADDDGDQITLIEEYAYNLNPTERDREILTPGSGTSGLPLIRVVGGRFQVEFLRRISDANFAAHAQFSGTLPGGFDVSPNAEVVTPINSEFERVVVDDSETTANSFRRFAKVAIELKAP